MKSVKLHIFLYWYFYFHLSVIWFHLNIKNYLSQTWQHGFLMLSSRKAATNLWLFKFWINIVTNKKHGLVPPMSSLLVYMKPHLELSKLKSHQRWYWFREPRAILLYWNDVIKCFHGYIFIHCCFFLISKNSGFCIYLFKCIISIYASYCPEHFYFLQEEWHIWICFCYVWRLLYILCIWCEKAYWATSLQVLWHVFHRSSWSFSNRTGIGIICSAL